VAAACFGLRPPYWRFSYQYNFSQAKSRAPWWWS